MADKYTVQAGDTLSEIAEALGTTVANLVKWNDIQDPDFIVAGQKLNTNADDAAESNTPTKLSSRAIVTVFGVQTNTDRTMYACWKWDQDNTDNYQVKWFYDTGDDVWFVGSDSNVKERQSVYSAPTNARKVKFQVKPIAKTRKVGTTEVAYWTTDWSTAKTHNFGNDPAMIPPVPTVTIKQYQLTALLENLELNATQIQFQIYKDNKFFRSSAALDIVNGRVSYSCPIDPGGEYTVRCRSRRGSEYSDYSKFSSGVNTIPAASKGITEVKALSATSVNVKWASVTNTESYDVEYTTKKSYFDSSSEVKSLNVTATYAEVIGLTSGEEYFFRVRAVNSIGKSEWTDIKSVVIGTHPSVPTTWSSTTTAITGEPLTLYWAHNSQDGSSQTYAELEIYVNDTVKVYTIENTTDEEEKDKTSSFVVDTSEYSAGVSLQWRVRTAGITKVYGEWSTQRTVDIYAPPTLTLNVTNSNGVPFDTLEIFPFNVYALAGPSTQLPIGYHLSVISNEIYETVDNVGNKKVVNQGDEVYSKRFDISSSLSVTLSANDIDLENNIRYTIKCIVSMNSGLTCEAESYFTVAWTDIQYEPNASIGIDKDSFTASIMPFCYNERGELPSDIELAIYRREFNGTFTEIATGVSNNGYTFVTDPHPALDYARYRIVAKTITTGAVSYFDVPGVPVECNSIIIQWAEEWSSFDATDDYVNEIEQPSWSGSMLKLPYNIDVSDSQEKDVALVKYIGREHPVSYYGTQVGTTATWNVEILKNDEETLYGLRRLAVWMGDVYVREPSGSGYWANISVSFSQKHRELTIPVTLNITRVEGGM